MIFNEVAKEEAESGRIWRRQNPSVFSKGSKDSDEGDPPSIEIIIAILACVSFVVLGLVLVLASGVWRFVGLGAGFAVLALAIRFVPTILATWQQYASRLARSGRCGACGFELDGLTPEDDGCVVCPECGAAWRA